MAFYISVTGHNGCRHLPIVFGAGQKHSNVTHGPNTESGLWQIQTKTYIISKPENTTIAIIGVTYVLLMSTSTLNNTVLLPDNLPLRPVCLSVCRLACDGPTDYCTQIPH